MGPVYSLALIIMPVKSVSEQRTDKEQTHSQMEFIPGKFKEVTSYNAQTEKNLGQWPRLSADWAFYNFRLLGRSEGRVGNSREMC